MKALIFTLVLFFLAAAIYAAENDGGETGVLYRCGFLRSIKIDGDLADWPKNVSWHQVTHDMGWNNPTNDEDGSFKFACVADKDYLYVAVKITDDKECINESIGRDVYDDDSVELYIDGDNSKATVYEPDVCQITIGRYNTGVNPEKPKLNAWTGENGQGIPADQTGTMVAVADDPQSGYAMEIAVPLKVFGIELANGTVIGFNIQLNDDDDGGSYDHKLSWSKKEREGSEASWTNPSVFGELEFVEGLLPVQEDKLLTVWGKIKR